MPDFSGYPSSLTGAGTTQYHLGVIPVNNLTNYQELKDTVVGYGAGTGDTVTVSFNSTAKYPTDLNIGGPSRASSVTGTGAAVGSSTVRDIELAIANFVAAGLALTTETFAFTAQQKAVADDFAVLSFMNIQSKIEKVTYEMNRLASDLNRIDTNTAGGAVTTPPGRYPSSWNRFTNTAGGI